MTWDELSHELGRGGKFVQYQFVVSVFFASFKRRSNVHFLRSDESAVVKGLHYVALTCLTGWLGIPWGWVWSVQAIYNNLRGGTDVTGHVVSLLIRPASMFGTTYIYV